MAKNGSKTRASGGSGKRLVVVESPAKARTIEGYLGRGYTVKASMGHVRDLPSYRLAVNTERDFAPSYEVLEDKRKVIADLKAAGAQAETIYLATDPDREGEAIAWHVVHAAGWKGKPIRRVVFHSITQDAVKEAFRNERGIDMELVNAQQARRIEDRLVGYKLSPLLKPLLGQELDRLDLDSSPHLTAGRVQSVALRLVVERDAEIDAFVPVEYWSIDAALRTEPGARFSARLQRPAGQKEKVELPNEGAAQAVLADLNGASWSVASVVRREVKERPYPPFITSTLQQQAASKLHFTAVKTMAVAQQLYEGIALGAEGPVGLITYMRTDSPQVSAQAVDETRRYVEERWGKEYLPPSPRRYRARSKVAQEAHEAIRPTSVERTPDAMRRHLTADQAKLYELIWTRMVASQMADALIDRTEATAEARPPADGAPGYHFRAVGSVTRFLGFQVLYKEERSEASEGEQSDKDEAPRQALPPLEQGQPLNCDGLTPEQHFTQPPRRYSEASLVRALEERGIGRPSTYAATIKTIIDRKYVTRERRVLQSTPLGKLVCGRLIAHFPDIMDVRFTGRMEGQLDEVANGKQEWVALLRDFYDPFSQALAKAQESIAKAAVGAAEAIAAAPCDKCGKPMQVKVGRRGAFLSCTGYPKCRNSRDLAGDKAEEDDPTDEMCEKCGKPMVVRSGRYGRFLACTGYPKCKNSRDLAGGKDSDEEQEPEEPVNETCEKCGKPMAVRRGRNGRFLACTGYPKCKNTRDLASQSAVPCPKGCGGALRQRRSRRGVFWGCSNYPNCDFTVNRQPLETPCPECNGLLTADGQDSARCTNCAYRAPISEVERAQAEAVGAG
ncbi:MAG: type I DNA topoisomerase [Chloroflexota bacterium]|nr:type I DNA topoisomerase [Chloroflexota bacterium]